MASDQRKLDLVKKKKKKTIQSIKFPVSQPCRAKSRLLKVSYNYKPEINVLGWLLKGRLNHRLKGCCFQKQNKTKPETIRLANWLQNWNSKERDYEEVSCDISLSSPCQQRNSKSFKIISECSFLTFLFWNNLRLTKLGRVPKSHSLQLLLTLTPYITIGKN